MPATSDVDFVCRQLVDGACIARLPESLIATPAQFQQLWDLHPAERPEILIHGRRVRTPRWQQVYGADYHFSGSQHAALPVPPDFAPFLEWGRETFEPRLNGVVVNWYDAAAKHYIGPHRDSTKNMLEGAPIIMISLGQSRTFRLRRWRGQDKIDVQVDDGSVIVLPYETNLRWTHEVKPPSRYQQNDAAAAIERFRISITLRALASQAAS